VIAGIGVDLCEIARIQAALTARHGARLRVRVFTAGERAYCEARRGAARFASYAARFAAKEATMKALGTGWGEGVSWTDVEVVCERGRAPALALHGGAAVAARARGCDRWRVSLSHTATTAVAVVVAERVTTSAPRRAARRPDGEAGSEAPRPRARR
jgi:holo-[acyl-carrier protein] synthase